MCRKPINTRAPPPPRVVTVGTLELKHHPPPPPPPPQRPTDQAKQIGTNHPNETQSSFMCLQIFLLLQASSGFLAQQTFLFIYLAAAAAAAHDCRVILEHMDATTRTLQRDASYITQVFDLQHILANLTASSSYLSCFLKHTKMWSYLAGILPSSVAGSAAVYFIKITHVPFKVLLQSMYAGVHLTK